jgi:hypothetical protein
MVPFTDAKRHVQSGRLALNALLPFWGVCSGHLRGVALDVCSAQMALLQCLHRRSLLL